ncbi:MAG TPA: hypothetical protein VLL48_05090, partial [Longimicrobiales bacterium]|nr:hypothetical protein [Longimicrobiales bacterium]
GLGAIVAAACCGLVWIALVQMRSREALKGPLRIAVAGILGAALVGALVAGWISFVLHGARIATYGAGPTARLSEFVGFYVWTFVDMIPALRITDTLDMSAPLEPRGLVAGLPLLAYRILVVYGVIAGARMWWRMRGDPQR